LKQIKDPQEHNLGKIVSPLFVAYFLIAIYFESWLVGFLAIMALETMLGFSMIITPL
jgi:hypothetical protein